MSGSASARFDWPGWRADVFERVDRRSIGVGSAWATACTAGALVGPWDMDVVKFAFLALFSFSIVMMTLVVLTVALVADARGISPWVAYPAAGFAALAIGLVLSVVIDPSLGTRPWPLSQAEILWHLSILLAMLCPPAVLYVYASSATYNDKVLRALEAERVVEAERLVRQRLQTELATVDHDLVLRAMRLALTAHAREAVEAEVLLAAVTAYLRAAQQRGSSEPERVAAALRELKEACAIGGEPAHA